MKMKRGELMGFSGCIGYYYNKEDKRIIINPEEEETERFIFDQYLQGYGPYIIRRELIRLEKKNKKGKVSWTESEINKK